jgi:hypothetical protein
LEPSVGGLNLGGSQSLEYQVATRRVHEEEEPSTRMIPVFGQFQDPGSHPSEANRMLCNVCGCETGSAAEHNHHMMMHVVDASSMGQSAGWGAGAPSAHMPSHLMHHGHGPAVHHHGGSRHQECGKISRRKGICVSRSPVREQRDSLQPKKRSCYGTAARDEFVLHSQLAQLRSPDLAGTLRSQNRWDEDGMVRMPLLHCIASA